MCTVHCVGVRHNGTREKEKVPCHGALGSLTAGSSGSNASHVSSAAECSAGVIHEEHHCECKELTLSRSAGRPNMSVSMFREEPFSTLGSARRLKASCTNSHGLSWPATAAECCWGPANKDKALVNEMKCRNPRSRGYSVNIRIGIAHAHSCPSSFGLSEHIGRLDAHVCPASELVQEPAMSD